MKSTAIHKCNLLVASRRYLNGQYPDNKKRPSKKIAVLRYSVRQVLLVTGAGFEPCGTLKQNYVPLPMLDQVPSRKHPEHTPHPSTEIHPNSAICPSNPDMRPEAPAPRSGSRDHRAVSLGLCAPLRHQCWTRLELGR